MGPPVLEKELIEDGTWALRKEVLGWLFDGLARTIELPQKKCKEILADLKAAFPKATRTATVRINFHTVRETNLRTTKPVPCKSRKNTPAVHKHDRRIAQHSPGLVGSITISRTETNPRQGTREAPTTVPRFR
jgi:hypothetical protein